METGVKNIKIYRISIISDNNDKICQTTVVMSIFYLVISIFEGFPPYGPGVASMAFWLFSGYLDGKYSQKNDSLQKEEYLS